MPRPRSGNALTDAERQAKRRAKLRDEGHKLAWVPPDGQPPVKVRYRRPADRRSRPQRWQDAVQTLAGLLDDYQSWRDSLPASLAESDIADRLDELLALRDLVDQLATAELPKGFGRD